MIGGYYDSYYQRQQAYSNYGCQNFGAYAWFTTVVNSGSRGQLGLWAALMGVIRLVVRNCVDWLLFSWSSIWPWIVMADHWLPGGLCFIVIWLIERVSERGFGVAGVHHPVTWWVIILSIAIVVVPAALLAILMIRIPVSVPVVDDFPFVAGNVGWILLIVLVAVSWIVAICYFPIVIWHPSSL